MSTARQAVWYGPDRPLAIEEVPLPEPLAGEVLVAVELATICGSDLHTVSGRRPAPSPSVLGHEQVGRVVAVGAGAADVAGDPLVAGDRVVWSLTTSCGRCDRCIAGLTNKCRTVRKYGHEHLEQGSLFGGFATHCLTRAGTAVVRVPAEVPAAVLAPASCATATVVAALDAAGGVGAGRRVLVAGAGMLGLTAAAVAHAAGAEVVVADPDAGRRSVVPRFGAAAVAAASDVRDVDVALELSGHAVAECLASLRVGGTAVLAGSVAPGPLVPVDPERITRELLRVVGVHNYRARHLVDAVAFLTGHHGRYPFADLVEPPRPLHEIGALLAAPPTRAPRRSVRP